MKLERKSRQMEPTFMHVIILKIFFLVVLGLGLRCTAFAKSLLAFSTRWVQSQNCPQTKQYWENISHRNISAEIGTRGRWVQSENAIHCATPRPTFPSTKKILTPVIKAPSGSTCTGFWNIFICQLKTTYFISEISVAMQQCAFFELRPTGKLVLTWTSKLWVGSRCWSDLKKTVTNDL